MINKILDILLNWLTGIRYRKEIKLSARLAESALLRLNQASNEILLKAFGKRDEE